MTLCSESILVNSGDNKARAVTLYCRSWSCEICQPRRKKQLIAAVAGGHPQRLLTLTMRPAEGELPAGQARFMALSFQRLIYLIKRKWPKIDHQYLAVFEAHESGWPHLHVAMRGCFMPWEWLSEKWEELTGSPGVDIRYVYNPKACAAYVAKYIGKDPQRFGSCKRYWSSTRWQVEPREERVDEGHWSNIWEPRDQSLRLVAEMWHFMGWCLWREEKTLYGGRDPPVGAVLIDYREVW